MRATGRGSASGLCPVEGAVVHNFHMTPEGRLTCQQRHSEQEIEAAWRKLLRTDTSELREEAGFQSAAASYAIKTGNAQAAVEAQAIARRLEDSAERRERAARVPARLLAEAKPGAEPDLTIGQSNDFGKICDRLRSPRCRELLFGRRGDLRWDTLRCDVVQSDPRAPRGHREMPEDLTIDRLRDRAAHTMFDEKGRPAKWPVEDVRRAVAIVAHESEFNPVQEWLSALPKCGPGAIDTVARRALHLSDDREVEIFRRFLTAAVARACYVPGAPRSGARPDGNGKVDTVLVLQSDRHGRRKGMFVEELASPWYDLVTIDPANKDTHMNLRGTWIAEWGELTMHSIRETESLNDFLTRPHDKYRAPYAPSSARHWRRWVLIATTNKWDFLRDQSGQFRRWWPLRLSDALIDVGCLLDLREQLWAEAYAAYMAGAQWHFEAAEQQAMLGDAYDRFRDRDVWEPNIRAYLLGLAEVTPAGVLTTGLGVPLERCDKMAQKRVEGVLRAAGWISTGATWRRPEREPGQDDAELLPWEQSRNGDAAS